jgi:hypothetical protein
MSEQHNVSSTVELDIFVTESNDVIVKISGFQDIDDAENYATYLDKNLALMLFESKVMH